MLGGRKPVTAAVAAVVALALPTAVKARSAYVANSTPGTISKIDAATNSVTGTTVALGGNTFGVAITPDGRRAYVPRTGFIGVAVLDTASNTPIQTVPDILSPGNIAISPDGGRAYVTRNAGNAVTVIDTNTDQVVGTFPGISKPGWIAVTPDGRRAYVTSQDDGTVMVVDLSSGAILKTLAQPGATGVAVSPDGSRVYVASVGAGGDKLSTIDTATNEFVGGGVALGGQAIGVAVAPDGSRIYVAESAPDDELSVIDAATLSLMTSYATGVDPTGIAVTPDGSRLYVTNQAVAGTVTVLNAATGATIATPSVESNPYGIAIDPDQGPTASFTVNAGIAAAGASGSPFGARAGTPTVFDASASSDPDGVVVRYDWDFGDGSTASEALPITTHQYQQPGTYTATLTVTDNEGASTERVFTGQTVLRNGSAAARKSQSVSVPAPDSAGPVVEVKQPKRNARIKRRKFKKASGTASDPSGVAKVEYAISTKVSAKKARSASRKRKKAARCKYLQKSGKLSKPRSCKKVSYLTATGTTSWSAKIRKVLPRGKYTLYARATDTLGNVSEPAQVRFRLA